MHKRRYQTMRSLFPIKLSYLRLPPLCNRPSNMSGYHIIITTTAEQSKATDDIKTFTPQDIFQRLPSHKPGQSHYHKNSISQTNGKDHRISTLQVDWMDFETTGRRPSVSVGKEKEKERGKGPAEATFVPSFRSKSGSTNLPEGIVHIFRNTVNRPTPEELAGKELAGKEFENLKLDESLDAVTLGVLAVPSWMTPSDFLTFIEPAVESIVHLRIIRDFAPNKSIALIKFTSPTDASDFTAVYNGKLFNSLEPEICHVVRILSIQIEPDDALSQAISRISSTYGPAQELPTCPVCLERMDSAVTGLITVPCSHTFHCMCLRKWGDSRCPVCRYTQNILTSHPTSAMDRSTRPPPFASPTPNSLCSECSSTTNLWICLICGNIGCGRYGRAHAQAHYQTTTHLYALELETQRVWDYAGDGYVHRLIQNKADGKLVELPSAASSMSAIPREGGLGPSQADALNAEKIEAIGIEYSYLLTSQLDSQRAYYEGQAEEFGTQISEFKGIVEQMSREREIERNLEKEEEKRRKEEYEQKLAQIEKQRVKAEQRADRMADLAKRLDKDLKEERAISAGLMKNMKVMQDRLDLAEKGKDDCLEKINELQDQVRDLMFFLDAKSKIEQGSGVEAEAAGGTVELPAPPSDPKSKRTRRGQ